MKATAEHNERIAKMTFASVYPHYVAKLEKKGRTIDELHEVIRWLTGFDGEQLQEIINSKITFKQMFERANLNRHAFLIIGTICGYKIEEIENPLTQKVRYLDKLVDELAKGKQLKKILRRS